MSLKGRITKVLPSPCIRGRQPDHCLGRALPQVGLTGTTEGGVDRQDLNCTAENPGMDDFGKEVSPDPDPPIARREKHLSIGHVGPLHHP